MSARRKAAATVPPESSLATTPALPEGQLMVDGVVHVSVRVAASPSFARACVKVLGQRDGRDHSHKLTYASFWVPKDVLALAREIVESGEGVVQL